MNPEEFRNFVFTFINERDEQSFHSERSDINRVIIDDRWNSIINNYDYLNLYRNSSLRDYIEEYTMDDNIINREPIQEPINNEPQIIHDNTRGIKGIENLVPFKWYNKYYNNEISDKLFYLGAFSKEAFLSLSFHRVNVNILEISKEFFADCGVVPYFNHEARSDTGRIIRPASYEYNRTNYLKLSKDNDTHNVIVHNELVLSLNLGSSYTSNGCATLINDVKNIVFMLLKYKQEKNLIDRILKKMRSIYINTHH